MVAYISDPRTWRGWSRITEDLRPSTGSTVERLLFLPASVRKKLKSYCFPSCQGLTVLLGQSVLGESIYSVCASSPISPVQTTAASLVQLSWDQLLFFFSLWLRHGVTVAQVGLNILKASTNTCYPAWLRLIINMCNAFMLCSWSRVSKILSPCCYYRNQLFWDQTRYP